MEPPARRLRRVAVGVGRSSAPRLSRFRAGAGRPGSRADRPYPLAFWDHPCYDCWEENGDRSNVATPAAIAAGLRVAADWPGVAPKVRSEAASATLAIGRRVRSDGVRNGHLVKWLGGTELDASVLFCAVPYRLLILCRDR